MSRYLCNIIMKIQLLRSLSIFIVLTVHCFSTLSAQEDLSNTSLDTYLQQNGFYLSPLHSNINEGYCTEAQKQIFNERLAELPDIQSVLEIGFNAGHSSEIFLKSSDNIELVSFDINHHPYTKVGVEFMQKKYLDRFTFIPGNSAETVKAYAASSGKKFDLIYIDGCHEYHIALCDIFNCRKLAHDDTVVWIDDYHNNHAVKGAVDFCVEQGVIQIAEKHFADDLCGYRSWVEVKYVNQ